MTTSRKRVQQSGGLTVWEAQRKLAAKADKAKENEHKRNERNYNNMLRDEMKALHRQGVDDRKAEKGRKKGGQVPERQWHRGTT